MFLGKNQWSSGMITGYDSADPGSIPGRVNFLKFQISIPMTFSHVQGYIYHNLDCNYHNHRGLVGVGVGLMTLRLLVRSHVGRIAGLDQPREASRSGSGWDSGVANH